MDETSGRSTSGNSSWRRRWLPPLIIVLVVIVALAVLLIEQAPGAGAAPPLEGTVLTERPAPSISLTDQFGRRVTLASLQGHPVILTFLDATCTQLCPVVTETLRRSLRELGPAAKSVKFVAVSTNPEGDTPAAVRRFSRQHSMLHRWLYLTGSRPELARVWHAYYVYAAPPGAPAAARNAHTSATFLIDARGRERVLMGGDPDTAAVQRDLLILMGLPVKPVGADAVPAPQVAHPAPDFRLPTVSGKQLWLQSLRGHVVIVNFWATWCHPCRTEAPLLDRWYRARRHQGLVVVGVDYQQGRAEVRDFATRFHLTYPIVLDASGSVSARDNVAGLPTSLIVDRHGVVAAVEPGALTSAYLQAHVLPLLQLSAHA